MGANHPTPAPNGTFSFFFVKPVLGTLLLMLFLVGGLFSVQSMVREGAPDLEIAIATVITTYPGASPELVEKQVTNELERKIKGVEGVKKLTSTTRHSVSIITVEFSTSVALQPALDALRAEVSKAESTLPSDAEKPVVEAVRLIDRPVVTFALFSDGGFVDDAILSDLAERLEDGLERLPGIRKAEVSGARQEMVTVLLNPARVAEMGLSPSKIAQIVEGSNVEQPLGKFENSSLTADLELKARFRSVAELDRLVVGRTPQSNAPIRLGDVADIRRDLEHQSVRTSLSVKGGPFGKSVAIDVFKGPSQDTVRLVASAAEYLEGVQRTWADWPEAVKVARIGDETESIEDILSSTLDSAWQACLIVFFVLLLLLTWREALVAGIAIMVTFVGAIFVLDLLGNTLNQMVLIGMILALGLLVDVFILVMEGLHDGLFSERMTFPQAAKKTVKLYAVPAFAGQMTTILALVPLFAIGGTAGKFISIIPTAIVTSLLVSFVVAFLIALPLSRIVLKAAVGQDESLVDRLTKKASAGLGRWLTRNVVATKGRSWLWLIAVSGMLWTSCQAASFLDFELFPKDDARVAGMTVELGPYAKLDDTAKAATLLGDFLRSQPEVSSVSSYLGRSSPQAGGRGGATVSENLGGFSLEFLPLEQRTEPAFKIVNRWRPKMEALMAEIPSARLEMHVQRGGPTSGSPIELVIVGDNLAGIKDRAAEVKKLLLATNGVTEVLDDVGLPVTTVVTRPRIETLDRYGLTAGDVARQVRAWVAGVTVGSFDRAGTREPIDIFVGMQWPSRAGLEGPPQSWEELAQVQVSDNKGRTYPLNSLVHTSVEQSGQKVNHRGGQRAIVVSAELGDRSAADAMKELQPKLDALVKTWPSEFQLKTGGESESTAETFADVPLAVVMALLLVFATLALVFGRFAQPLIILVAVPIAVMGTLFGFFFADIPFSFPATIGVIALIGIVVNDTIVMVETMNLRLHQGASLIEASALGASDRLRPIVSTTLTTIGGMIPLAISMPFWAPLAMAVVFGLMSSTVFAFIVVPALYRLVTKPIDHTV